jgi:hypothetical protein
LLKRFILSYTTREKTCLTVSVLRDEKAPWSLFQSSISVFDHPRVNKMSTASLIGENSRVSVTLNKGADDKAQPQLVWSLNSLGKHLSGTLVSLNINCFLGVSFASITNMITIICDVFFAQLSFLNEVFIISLRIKRLNMKPFKF